MMQPFDGSNKQAVVRQALEQFWQTWPESTSSVGAALRLFGSQYNAADSSKSCQDTLLLSAPRQIPTGFGGLMDTAEARGMAPVAEALYAATGDFYTGQKKAVVLITDSGDTCAGDPCNWAVTQYHDAGLVMPVYVIDLGGKSGLECLATASGGRYFAVDQAAGLQDALNQSLSAFTIQANPAGADLTPATQANP